jgi:cytochrome c2
MSVWEQTWLDLSLITADDVAPGTGMTIFGLRNPAGRIDVILSLAARPY